MIDHGEEEYQNQTFLRSHLAERSFRALARRPGRSIVIDRTAERRVFSAGKLLAVSMMLSRFWRQTIPGTRVGIILPPGGGAFVTNLAVVFSGKVPVNLNFTAGRSSTESSINRSGIETIITADAVKEKIQDVPWVEDTRDLSREIGKLSKLSILIWMILVRILPVGLLLKLFSIPSEGDSKEAALLFSSGSTGEPKGVILTHRNILSNCQQIADCGLLGKNETVMACLPMFHSFGFTVTLWCPILYDFRVATVPSPLETRRIVQVVKEEKVSIIVGAPTFFRPYFRQAKSDDLKSLNIVIAGAEKTPAGFKERWEEQFGSTYLEGYGLTETSPVVSTNLLESLVPEYLPGGGPVSRTGSVGRLFPGMAAKIVDPESGKEMPVNEVGILELRGPNIFQGYLGDAEQTRKTIRNGWLTTGDLARFDDDGFIFIEGRVRRFSKIGGEAVPHGTIEEYIAEAFGISDNECPAIAVTGITDEKKGEALVLLTTEDISVGAVREKLISAGLPNLWIPRKIKKVSEIPCLASGKLDLGTIEKIAAES